ncbi:MAG: T9SS type A sorting domain-containing protein, partial [Candidatus Kapaibacterium sp.]
IQALMYFTPDFAVGFCSLGTEYTTDQGSHWRLIRGRNPDYSFLSGIVYSPPTFYELCTTQKNHTAFTESSLDTGNTFQLISNPFAIGKDPFQGAFMHDSMNIWALITDSVSSSTSCLHTTDGGLHWSRSFPADTTEGKNLIYSGQFFGNEDLGSFYIRNSQLVDSNYRHELSWIDLLFTTNGGTTWQADSSNHRRLPFATSSGKNKLWGFIGIRDNHYRYLCDTLAYSPNNGKNWYYDSESIKGDSVVFMTWKDSTHGYIISYKDSTITFAKYIPLSSEVIVKTFPYLAFNLSPTITSDVIHFTSYLAFNGTISFYDVLGRLQIQKTLVFANGEEKDFSLSGLSSGMYFITYASGNMYNSARIIKE